ncbi:hypothetical protein BDQ17DRAFT_1420428 [Cyathus striatus]|nr:hypothetical protein BDQ17DRAFT_1420428 [Cyathus striatus]
MSDGNKLEGEQQPHAGPSGTRSNFDEGPSITEIQSRSVSSGSKTRKSKDSVRRAPQSGSRALQGTTTFTVGEDRGGVLASTIPHHSPTAGSNVSESGGRVLSGAIPPLPEHLFSTSATTSQTQRIGELEIILPGTSSSA